MDDYKYTCKNCGGEFLELELPKECWNSDCHRYNNSKGKIPPTQTLKYMKRFWEEIEKEKEECALSNPYCKPCRKDLENKNEPSTSQNNNMEEDKENVEVDSDEWEGEPIAPNDCLFCQHHSRSLHKNMNHMTDTHSFFIPNLKYCVNMEALISYLGEKVGCAHRCLFCGIKSRNFVSKAAVQSHMRARGHCMMKIDGENLFQYIDFFDYSSSCPDDDVTGPDDVAPGSRIELNEFNELVLPSGAILGHRSLLKYYKQRLNPDRRISVSKGGSANFKEKFIKQYKANGWKQACSADVKKMARDISYMRRYESQHIMQLGIKANKFQPYFRQQVKN